MLQTLPTASAVITESVVRSRTRGVREYSPSDPFITELRYDEGVTPAFNPVKPVPHRIKFQLPPPRPNVDDFETCVMDLSRVYLSDRYIIVVFDWTLQYIDNRNLHPREVFKLVPRDILHVFCNHHLHGILQITVQDRLLEQRRLNSW